ncbi:site-specific integrase [Rhodovulum tesquicola]|uniref:site-specific integrase n=1 Tax=Rhodovulum tesquicola TaxID=540254 RepID=UPI002096D7D9|nr:site-specific integrase [Rhodovulum tesquicola]MCO8145700.1 site-specific integrase [Rhodovulum tesquicola]
MGRPLTEPQIRKFKEWLRSRAIIKRTRREEEASDLDPEISEQDKPSKLVGSEAKTINSILDGVASFEDWCLRHALVRHGHQSKLVDVRAVQSELWKSAHEASPKVRYAEDFTDDEILQIEQYFRSLAFMADPDRVNPSDFRNYVIWRMAIEYGLRIGEILAFRTIDLPSREANYIKIVRIEERRDPPDPRGKSAPRPKTLSRDLGTYFANSSFPDLFSKYVAEYRWAEVYNPRLGKTRRRFVFDHPYLFISDHGSPLPSSTIESIGARVAKELKIKFHWHKARHSFFNRIYAAAERIPNTTDRERARQQMQYLGGWSSPESLMIYTLTARRDTARRGSFILSGPEEKPVWDVLG